MKFGVFFEHQVPRPWTEDSERVVFQNGLEEAELADELGYDYIWVVEHHFMEEASHSSAPDLFLAACSQRTKNIRLGHGVNLTSPFYAHPARTAERVATLDLLSNGRLEWGTGESASTLELAGFGIEASEKNGQWLEGTTQALDMMSCTPYPGYDGKYFRMPARNIVPKPYQKPHPPMWLACSRRESILRAARLGVGALVFGFVEPEQAAGWIKEYYDIIKSDQCVPLGYSVNANIACVNALSLHEDHDEAVRRGTDGFKFFGYTTGYYYSFGSHKPGVGSVWDRFVEAKDQIPENAGHGGIGTPEEVGDHVRRYASIGLDQLIFLAQSGRNSHDHTAETLRTFAQKVMPEFKASEAERLRKKNEELAPYIAAALARRAPPPTIRVEDIPSIKSPGVMLAEQSVTQGKPGSRGLADPTRGGGVPNLLSDPSAARSGS